MELLLLIIFFLCIIVVGLLWLLCTLESEPHNKFDEPRWREPHDYH